MDTELDVAAHAGPADAFREALWAELETLACLLESACGADAADETPVCAEILMLELDCLWRTVDRYEAQPAIGAAERLARRGVLARLRPILDFEPWQPSYPLGAVLHAIARAEAVLVPGVQDGVADASRAERAAG